VDRRFARLDAELDAEKRSREAMEARVTHLEESIRHEREDRGAHTEKSLYEDKGFPDIGKAIGDIAGNIGKITSGAANLEADADNVTTQVKAFGEVVKSTAKDLATQVTAMDPFTDAIQKVDTAGHTIWTSFKSILDVLTKAGADFDTGVGSLLSGNSFKSFFDNAIAAIVEEGDSLQSNIDLQLSSLAGSANATCGLALQEIESLQGKASNLTAIVSNLTENGMKQEIEALYDELPANVKEQIDEFTTKVSEMALTMKTTVTESATEIYNSFGLALQKQCPNFATFVPSLAAALKVGMATAIAVSAAAFTL
jgi:uncharacterized protein YoxC